MRTDTRPSWTSKLAAALLVLLVPMGCAGPLGALEETAGVDPPSDPPPPPTTTAEFPFQAPITQIVAGAVPSYAVLSDGTVWGWTDFPQPPDLPQHDGSYWSVEGPTPVLVPGLQDVTQVAFRFRHGCALHRDKTVSCWGENESGQLATGDYIGRWSPTRVEGLEGAVEIDVGEQHSCARLEDGTVACWGTRAAYWPVNPSVEGNIVDRHPFRLEGFPKMASLALSRLHTCATGADGASRCWGNLWPDDPTQSFSLDDQLAFRDFALDDPGAQLLNGSCALLESGSIACACQNEEVGVEQRKLPCYQQGAPVSSFGDGVIQAVTRVAQACALFAGGEVRCTGDYFHSIWLGDPWHYKGWETIGGIVSASAIDVGVNACAIDGACVRCWGPTIGREPRTVGCYVESLPPPH